MISSSEFKKRTYSWFLLQIPLFNLMNDCPLNFDELPWQHNQQFYTDLEVNCLNVVNLYLNLSLIKTVITDSKVIPEVIIQVDNILNKNINDTYIPSPRFFK